MIIMNQVILIVNKILIMVMNIFGQKMRIIILEMNDSDLENYFHNLYEIRSKY